MVDAAALARARRRLEELAVSLRDGIRHVGRLRAIAAVSAEWNPEMASLVADVDRKLSELRAEMDAITAGGGRGSR